MSRPSMSELVDLVTIKRLPLDKVSDGVIHSALSGKISYPQKKAPKARPNKRALSQVRALSREADLAMERAQSQSFSTRLLMHYKIMEYESSCMEVDRTQVGHFWRSNLLSAGFKLAKPALISTEDLNDAIMAVWRSKHYRPPTYADPSTLRGRKTLHKYYKALATYLNTEHRYDRDRQEKAQDLRACLRRLRYHVLMNPYEDDRSTNQTTKLAHRKITLHQMAISVIEANKDGAGHHTDPKPSKDYISDLATIVAAMPKDKIKKFPESLAPLVEPRKREWFVNLNRSLV